tara:strand:+ start:149 stop:451 length:303 start_codon:yes stop_codon:yes gene_type:complete
MGEEREDFNFWPLWRLLIPAGVIGIIAMIGNPQYNTARLDELVRKNDNKPGLSINDVRTFSEYLGIDQKKLEIDFEQDGKLSYNKYPVGNLKRAWRKYCQ